MPVSQGGRRRRSIQRAQGSMVNEEDWTPCARQHRQCPPPPDYDVARRTRLDERGLWACAACIAATATCGQSEQSSRDLLLMLPLKPAKIFFCRFLADMRHAAYDPGETERERDNVLHTSLKTTSNGWMSPSRHRAHAHTVHTKASQFRGSYF